MIDSGERKGEEAIPALRKRTEESLERYVALANRLGCPASPRFALGTEVVDEAEKLARTVGQEFRHTTFFSGQLIFRREAWSQRLPHDQTAYTSGHGSSRATRRCDWRVGRYRSGANPSNELHCKLGAHCMRIRPRLGDVLWMAAGAALLLLFGLLVLLFGKEPSPNAELALRAQRMELVDRMQLGLLSASEAEKSAVLAVTDPESQAFADQARARTADVERDRQQLEGLLNEGGTRAEKDSLADFSRRFIELQRIDGQLLSLAVQNTNLKAYALTFGPAAGAVDEMRAALSRLVTANIGAPDAKKVMSLAFGAEIGALRIQTLLPPHIAEAEDAQMSQLEAQMAKEDEQVRTGLEGLAALPKLEGRADLTLAESSYTRFRELQSKILALSRENTNLRSLSLSLNEKRKAMLACHDVLGKLEDAIRKEPVGGGSYGGRFRLR